MKEINEFNMTNTEMRYLKENMKLGDSIFVARVLDMNAQQVTAITNSYRRVPEVWLVIKRIIKDRQALIDYWADYRKNTHNKI